MAKHGELKEQWGERDYRSHFQSFLAQKGIDENTWGNADNAWHTRMDADKSGQLWARYHQIESGLSLKAHMSDVADMSQDVKGGLSLDIYARISAEIAQPGADFAAVLAKLGVTQDAWNTGREAWNAAMAQDTMHKITTQYGLLYAKYNPAHQAAMMAQAGQIVANRNESSSVDDTPEEEYTFDKAMEEVQSGTPKVRWKAAHLLCQKVQTEVSGDPMRQKLGRTACIPVLIECLERHDKATVSDAESAARDLVELEHFTDDAKGAIARCLARSKDHLATVQAAFAPIKNKNVPERVYLQSEMQDYQSLVETLQDIVNEWDEKAADARSNGAHASSSNGSSRSASGGDSTGGIDDAIPTGAPVGFIQKILSFFR